MSNQMTDERTFSMTWTDPLESAQAGLAMSGLEYMQAVVSGDIGTPPIAALLGMSVVEAEEGRALFALEPAERHYNPIGVVHGGIAATILDSAMGCAVHTTLPAGWSYGTLDLSARFIRPITVDTGRILCEGVVVHRGSKTATTEGRVWAEDGGKLLAHGTGSALLLPVVAD
jgi:uncharacterized protein (TIGR00369 family)